MPLPFDFPRGGYTPAITDGRTLFLVGYGAMYALQPLSEAQKEKIAERKRARAKRAKARKRAIRVRCVKRA